MCRVFNTVINKQGKVEGVAASRPSAVNQGKGLLKLEAFLCLMKYLHCDLGLVLLVLG
jgi:hypothetical protein